MIELSDIIGILQVVTTAKQWKRETEEKKLLFVDMDMVVLRHRVLDIAFA